MEIATVRPFAAAIEASNSSSASDSTLTQRMPSSTASASSRAVLPTPENMILSGANAGGARAQQFAFGNDIGAGAELRQRRDDGLVGIRLHGVADQRVDIGERAGKDLVVPLQRRGRIAIERRADAFRQRDEIDLFGVQHAVAISEVVHGELLARSKKFATAAAARAAGRSDRE